MNGSAEKHGTARPLMTSDHKPVDGETPLQELLRRVEGATRPSAELSALILCATAAPSGAYVEQSPFNGAWCIYDGTASRAGVPRLWERTGKWYRPEGWAVTTSVDAALALIERVLPGWHWSLYDTDGRGFPNAQIEPPEHSYEPFNGVAPTPALALCAALLKALISREVHVDGSSPQDTPNE